MLTDIASRLSDAVDAFEPGEPVTHTYNPFDYAREIAWAYLETYGERPGRKAIWVGMNPGPWGMAQTGVPFGDVDFVRDWMGLAGEVRKPSDEHPKRLIEGLDCGRNEVSGSRLWGWARERYGSADAFFDEFFVWNYCPLSFMKETGANYTPNKLSAEEREKLFAPCDQALREVVQHLNPQMVVGVGVFAEKRAEEALDGIDVPIGRVLHPSPASPKANRGWAGYVEEELAELGLL